MIYLDNAATSFPKAPGVADAVREQLASPGGNAGRGNHVAAQQSSDLLGRTRLALARFLGIAHPHRLAFMCSATDALNAALKGVLQPGNHVVTTHLEHNSVLRPLHGLQARRGVERSTVCCSPDGFADPRAIADACRKETRLIVISHVSNVVGTIQPIEAIIAQAHAAGILVLVDAAQSAGDIPCRIDELGADMVALPGHKGLLGPQGVGALYVREEVELSPWREGGTGSDSHREEQPDAWPTHLEAGTHNLPGLAGLLAALEWHEREGDAARANQSTCVAYLLERLTALPCCTVYGPPTKERRAGPISFNLAGWCPTDASAVLDSSFGIALRAGLHCAPLVHADIGAPAEGTLRASPGPFTTPAELDALVDALAQMGEHHPTPSHRVSG